jgi:diguanylate cyclase (GGDEF)-like protein/PAS domain S-box-containing protein
VIFITANFGPDEEAHGLSLGAVDFIAKPLNPVVLQARVQTQILLKRQSDQLRDNEARLLLASSVFSNAREAILITDAQGLITDVNDTFCRITGYSHAEALGRSIGFMQPEEGRADFMQKAWAAVQSSGYWHGEIWKQRKNGTLFANLCTINEIKDQDQLSRHYACFFSDITAIKDYQRQLEHIAYYDPLTGLANRVMLSDRLAQAKAQAQRWGTSLAIVYLDLDGFKPINDRFGHETGDRMLVGVAHALRDALRAGDSIARFGGDEFVAFIADLEQPGDCVPVLQRLLDAASATVHVGDLALKVSASLGVSIYPKDDGDIDQLVRHADQAMYLAKQNGKNQIQFYDSVKEASVKAMSSTVDEVRLGLKNREFVLYYQPKVNMKTGAVVGAEALIRWQHATRGLQAPGMFLQAIENHALSIELGEWVIASALQQMADWSVAGFHVPVSVNVGALQLQQPDFLARLQGLLSAAPAVPAGSLSLEILETSALSDLQRMTRLMEDCRGLGVDFSLDDFGTGYSSLSYLKSLPAKTLKIDQTFVRDMSHDPDDLAIVKGVVGLAHAFGRQVIAEGIELLQDGESLLRLGCELGQGYFIARPMPAQALPDWARNWQTPERWRKQIYVPRDSIVLLSTMVQRAPVGICIIDAQGVFRDVNARYCALYGYAREELVGQVFTLVFAPEDRPHVHALHDNFMNEGGELIGSWHAVRKDGGRIPITSESIRVPGEGDLYNRLVYVVKNDNALAA